MCEVQYRPIRRKASLSVTWDEVQRNTIANLADDFGKFRGEKKLVDGEAGVGRGAKTLPVITAHLICDGYNVMAY